MINLLLFSCYLSPADPENLDRTCGQPLDVAANYDYQDYDAPHREGSACRRHCVSVARRCKSVLPVLLCGGAVCVFLGGAVKGWMNLASWCPAEVGGANIYETILVTQSQVWRVIGKCDIEKVYTDREGDFYPCEGITKCEPGLCIDRWCDLSYTSHDYPKSLNVTMCLASPHNNATCCFKNFQWKW